MMLAGKANPSAISRFENFPRVDLVVHQNNRAWQMDRARYGNLGPRYKHPSKPSQQALIGSTK